MAEYGGIIPMSSASNWAGTIKWWYTQNAAEGTTTIEAKLFTQKSTNAVSVLDKSDFSGTLTVRGNSESFTYSSETTVNTERKTIIAVIKHTGSGKLLDCVIEGVVTATSDEGVVTLKGSRDVSATIPRIIMSSDFDAMEDVDFGANIDITWTPESASYYYIVKITFEGETKTSSVISPRTTGQYRYRGITIPLEWASLIPNSVYGVVSLVVTAYTNSSCTSQKGAPLVGAFTVSVPSNIIPKITECTAVIDNSLGSVDPEWNVAVSGHTQVILSAKGEGVYGSTIRNFKITGAANATIPYGTLENYRTGIIRSAGQKIFIVTCTDTRGRVSQEFVATPSITFLEYTRPSITKFLMSRVKDENGKVHPAASASWEFADIHGRNSAKATLYYKQSDADNWTTYSTDFPMNVRTTLDIEFTDLKSYNFKLVVTDVLDQRDQRDGFLSTAEVILDFMAGGTGLGIGKICENPGLEVSMDATFFGNVKVRDQNGQIVALEDYIDNFLDPLRCITVTLSKNGWSQAAPYTQRVYYKGMTADRNYGPPFITGLTNADAITAAKEALSCIDGGSTETDYLVFKCYESAPDTDITITMQGIISE